MNTKVQPQPRSSGAKAPESKDWNDPEVRRRKSAPALRAFFNIAKLWALNTTEERALLGWPARSTYHKYKSGQTGTLSFDTLMRLSLIVGIYKALQVLYPEAAFADRWVRLPNTHPIFGGRPALDLMTEVGSTGCIRCVVCSTDVAANECPSDIDSSYSSPSCRYASSDSEPVSDRRPSGSGG